MKIVVAGGTGFIGEPLVEKLVSRQHDVAVLSRNPNKVRAGRGVLWDGKAAGPWTAEVDAADAVINLAGENIGAGRWTAERKRALVDSRLDATNAIVKALLDAPRRDRVLVNASAVGYYGFDRQLPADEDAPKGSGFLADLVDLWERAAKRAESAARVVILRFGVALGPNGGALEKMAMPFRFFVGGRVGSGHQWMSWVDRDDALSAIVRAVEEKLLRGVYNITSPNPVTNREFTKSLANVLHRPALFPVPAFVLRLVFGDMADEALLGGQPAVPRRAEAAGFTLQFRNIESALQHAFTDQ